MHPAFSVLFLTTLIGAGQGLFLALFSVEAYGELGLVPAPGSDFFATGSLLSLVLLGLGLFASFLPPGPAGTGLAHRDQVAHVLAVPRSPRPARLHGGRLPLRGLPHLARRSTRSCWRRFPAGNAGKLLTAHPRRAWAPSSPSPCS
jgi:hypothetical protein